MRASRTFLRGLIGFMLLLALALTQTAKGATPADAKPMGAWFVSYDKYIIDDEFIWTTGAYIDSNWGTINVDQLSKYSAVLVGQGAGKKLSAKENETLEKWVAAGGTLIFTGTEPRVLWDNKPPAWVAGEGALAHWQHEAILPKVQVANHALLRGVPDLGFDTGPKGEKLPWQTDSALRFTVGQSLVGQNLPGNTNVSILYENQHGKGKIIYADSHFIPNRWPGVGQVPGLAWTLSLKPLEKQFLSNLMAYLNIPNHHDVIAAWAAGRAKDDTLAVWFRDEPGQQALGGRVHCPPYPLRGDEFKEMRFDSGIGELVRRDFFVTTTKDSLLTVEATDLVGKHNHTIPAGQIRLFIQDKPTPDYPKASYFLVDPKDVEPLDSPAVKLDANEAYTYWIMIDSGEAAPGDYTGALNFRDGGRLLKSVPIRVKVWPLHQPPAEVLHFEMEHFWYGMPGGNWADPKNSKSDLLKKYIDNLGRLSVDVGQTWGDIGMGYYNKFIRLRSDGRNIDQAISESPELFLKEPMPSLSFCGPHDLWWDNAIQAGMSSFSESWSLTEISADMARRVHKEDKISVGSPEHLRFVTWFWGEYRKYLRERGLYKMYIKLGDEAGPEGIPDYIHAAAPMQAAGYKLYTTAYNMVAAKESIIKLDPYMDMWQLGFLAENLRTFLARNNVPFDASNEVWATAASSYWNGGYSYGHGLGMDAARLRLDGVHLHGYLRWQRNEFCGVYLGRDDKPCDSVEATNWGQAISDGRYLAQLYRMIDLAKKTGHGAKTAAKIEAEIDRDVIGLVGIAGQPVRPGPLPLIPLQADATEFDLGGAKMRTANPVPGLLGAPCVAAKVKVFEMLLRLQHAMGDPATDVMYENIPLVHDGEPVCRIVCGADDGSAKALAARINDMGGATPPVVTDADLKTQKPSETLVLIGTLKDNATLAAVVKQVLPTEITPFYPVAGAYVIERLPAKDGRPAMIIVAGGDATAVQTGVRNLCKLMTREMN